MLRPQTRDIRSFWHTTALAATAGAGEGALSLFLDYALRFLRLALLLSVWRMILFPPSGGAPPAAAPVGASPMPSSRDPVRNRRHRSSALPCSAGRTRSGHAS